jgi:hypothetical protein
MRRTLGQDQQPSFTPKALCNRFWASFCLTPYGVTMCFLIATQGAPVNRRPWATVCNAYGVCRDRHMHIPSKRGDANELTSLTLRVSSAHRAHSHLGQA